ncbi:hypothetical protein F5Y19DRAFT_192588 [Xylariaceae sp. FL1651]|nr:hypothetical protein F5Y19DRAFT_192588 [Xylariaceae sp. FL1651]
MAQHQATPQGAKRRFPFSSPPGLHTEESEGRRPPYPPPGPMGGLQAPQVGVAVVTIDMFREYQRQVATSFDLQNNQIALLQERVQSIEGRVQSLEDAEDMAIDAVREIRDGVIPRVEQHHESLNNLKVALTRQNTILEALGSLGQEVRANHSRNDAVRPSQLAWRPGPLGGANDQTKSSLEDLKAQVTRSFASLAEHDRHLGENDTRLGVHDRHMGENDTRLGVHDRHLGENDTRLGAHDARLGVHDRHLMEHDTRIGAHDRHLGEHDKCLGEYSRRFGALDPVSAAFMGKIVGALADRALCS